MITLLPIGKVILIIAVIYAAVSGVFIWLTYDSSTSFLNVVGIALGGSTFLNAVLFFLFNYYWQCLWRTYPVLNKLVFPDLNGKWDMIIEWESGDKSGKSNAIAEIKQTFLSITMEVEAKDSYSSTLIVQANKAPNSGRPFLYYIYHVTPKNTSQNSNVVSYTGAAILQLSLENKNRLSGNYFTDRETKGHFELNKRSS